MGADVICELRTTSTTAAPERKLQPSPPRPSGGPPVKNALNWEPPVRAARPPPVPRQRRRSHSATSSVSIDFAVELAESSRAAKSARTATHLDTVGPPAGGTAERPFAPSSAMPAVPLLGEGGASPAARVQRRSRVEALPSAVEAETHGPSVLAKLKAHQLADATSGGTPPPLRGAASGGGGIGGGGGAARDGGAGRDGGGGRDGGRGGGGGGGGTAQSLSPVRIGRSNNNPMAGGPASPTAPAASSPPSSREFSPSRAPMPRPGAQTQQQQQQQQQLAPMGGRQSQAPALPQLGAANLPSLLPRLSQHKTALLLPGAVGYQGGMNGGSKAAAVAAAAAAAAATPPSRVTQECVRFDDDGNEQPPEEDIGIPRSRFLISLAQDPVLQAPVVQPPRRLLAPGEPKRQQQQGPEGGRGQFGQPDAGRQFGAGQFGVPDAGRQFGAGQFGVPDAGGRQSGMDGGGGGGGGSRMSGFDGGRQLGSEVGRQSGTEGGGRMPAFDGGRRAEGSRMLAGGDMRRDRRDDL